MFHGGADPTTVADFVARQIYTIMVEETAVQDKWVCFGLALHLYEYVLYK